MFRSAVTHMASTAAGIMAASGISAGIRGFIGLVKQAGHQLDGIRGGEVVAVSAAHQQKRQKDQRKQASESCPAAGIESLIE